MFMLTMMEFTVFSRIFCASNAGMDKFFGFLAQTCGNLQSFHVLLVTPWMFEPEMLEEELCNTFHGSVGCTNWKLSR